MLSDFKQNDVDPVVETLRRQVERFQEPDDAQQRYIAHTEAKMVELAIRLHEYEPPKSELFLHHFSRYYIPASNPPKLLFYAKSQDPSLKYLVVAKAAIDRILGIDAGPSDSVNKTEQALWNDANFEKVRIEISKAFSQQDNGAKFQELILL